MRLIVTTLVELSPDERAFMRHWRGKRPRKVLAHKIGVARPTLARWEQGATNPSAEMHQYWIEALRLLDLEAEAAA